MDKERLSYARLGLLWTENVRGLRGHVSLEVTGIARPPYPLLLVFARLELFDFPFQSRHQLLPAGHSQQIELD
jgi:hypothetical protein